MAVTAVLLIIRNISDHFIKQLKVHSKSVVARSNTFWVKSISILETNFASLNNA